MILYYIIVYIIFYSQIFHAKCGKRIRKEKILGMTDFFEIILCLVLRKLFPKITKCAVYIDSKENCQEKLYDNGTMLKQR